MKKKFIIANWKSNKTLDQINEWFEGISKSTIENSNKEIVLCPSFLHLSAVKELIKRYNLPFQLGTQDISGFDEGSFTGDVNGKQIKEFCKYVLIGHSERRRYLQENDQMLEKKTKMANKNNIIPIFCVEDSNVNIPKSVEIVAYEPVFAIESGNPDTPENANTVAQKIKQLNPQVKHVLYGGSVDEKNVQTFTQMQDIEGVLIGKASLNPHTFLLIAQHA